MEETGLGVIPQSEYYIAALLIISQVTRCEWTEFDNLSTILREVPGDSANHIRAIENGLTTVVSHLCRVLTFKSRLLNHFQWKFHLPVCRLHSKLNGPPQAEI